VDYGEAETVLADWQALSRTAGLLATQLPASIRDAYYQLVQFPVQASALVNELYFAAGRNALYARQGRASAAHYADRVEALFAEFMKRVEHYNTDFANGRWAHFMDQTVLGYTAWNDPPQNSLRHLRLQRPEVPAQAGIGVMVEGSAAVAGATAELPRFDALNRQRSWFEVFERGRGSSEVKAGASHSWIRVSMERDSSTGDRRWWVDIDWSRVQEGVATGGISITADGQLATAITVTAVKPAVTRASLRGHAEGHGVVSIEPAHFTRNIAAGAARWSLLADYGRTLSGMRAEAPVDAPSATPGKDSPCLEYRIHVTTTGPVDVIAITSPTLNFVPGRGLRYAVSIDDEAPQMVTLVPEGYQAQNGNRDWEKAVGDNARYGKSRHAIATTGDHTLKVWMVDPAVVVTKLVVDLGGLKPSYLGPPESFHALG
jgi:hypothetical protein